MPEINLKDVLRYGRMSNRWYFFLPKPQMAIDGMQIKQKKEYPVGMYISPGMKPDLEKYLNEALHVVVDRDHKIYEDVESYNEIKMVSQIPSMRLCEELLYYTRDGNFDSVSAAMLFATVKRQRESQPVMNSIRDTQIKQDSQFMDFLESNQSRLQERYNPAFSY